MSRSVRVVTCGAATGWEPDLVAACSGGDLGIEIVARCHDYGEVLARADLDSPDVLLVGADTPWLDADSVSALASGGPLVVAVDGQGPNERLARMGIAHTVSAAAAPERIAGALLEAVRPLPPQGPPEETGGGAPGRIVCVWGPKGSTGRTMLAVNLAWEMAASGDVVLVDLDTYGGSVAVALDLGETPGVVQFVRAAAAGRLDPEYLRATALQPRPGLWVLPGIARADLWPEIRTEGLSRLLDVARGAANVVVCDVAPCIEDDEELLLSATPWRRNQAAIAALEQAEVVLVPVTPDPAGVRAAVLALADARPLLAGAGVEIVLNGASAGPRRAAEAAAEIEARTGYPVVAGLPRDSRAAAQAAWTGRALAESAPRTQLRRRIAALALRVGAGA